jgi:NADH-quinone oxidoreductase subunit C
MLQFDQILSIVKNSCTSSEPVADANSSPKIITVSSHDLREVCAELLKNSTTFFDMLSCITPIDNGVQTGTMDIVYNLYSIPFNHHVAIKIVIPRDGSEVASISDIWKTANWHEREAFDMFGIKFTGHPDLRRILMPADWDGHPLRKDYKQQEYYREIKVAY